MAAPGVKAVVLCTLVLPAALALVCYDCSGYIGSLDTCDIVNNTTRTWECLGAEICFSWIHTIVTMERLIVRSCHLRGFCDERGFCVECDSDLCNTVY